MIKRVGDVVFDPQGRPGVVTNRDPARHDLNVQRQGEGYERARGMGFINGMPVETRRDYEAILERVRDIPDMEARVGQLKKEIDDLGEDPKTAKLRRYLTSEMVFLMNSENIRQREYRIDETKIR